MKFGTDGLRLKEELTRHQGWNGSEVILRGHTPRSCPGINRNRISIDERRGNCKRLSSVWINFGNGNRHRSTSHHSVKGHYHSGARSSRHREEQATELMGSGSVKFA